MGAPWTQDFDFYLSTIDDKRASIVVDLAAVGQEPLPTHPLLLAVRVPMKRPREDGLRDGSEREDLGEIEDRFTTRLEQSVDAIYVGRIMVDGSITLYYYVRAEARARIEGDLPGLLGDSNGYVVKWALEEDPDWDHLTIGLAPDPYARQEIWNRRILHQFVSRGDALQAPREVDHVVVFPTLENAVLAIEKLEHAGFRVDPPRPSEDGGHRLEFHRDEILADGRPDEFVTEVLDVVLALDGDYDGWGAMVVVNPGGGPPAEA